MKRLAAALALLGLAAATVAVALFGLSPILRAVGRVGWGGFGLLLGWQLVLFVVLGAAWRLVCPGTSLLSTIWGRLVREGGTNCLPLSELGGLVFGARALMLRGVSGPRATVSTVADITAEAIAEAPFVGFGVAVLAWQHPGSSLLWPSVAGLALAAAVGGGLATVTRRPALLRRIGHRIARSWFPAEDAEIERLGDEAERIFGRTAHLALASLVHLIAWVGGGVSVLIAYRAMGQPIGIVPAVAIEAMLGGALSIAFIIPAGLGVQELSYVGIGALFGMPPHASLALSLLRRARDLVIGAPALGVWQLIEARHLRREPGAAPMAPAAQADG